MTFNGFVIIVFFFFMFNQSYYNRIIFCMCKKQTDLIKYISYHCRKTIINFKIKKIN